MGQELRAETFSAEEMRGLRHLLFHFRSEATLDEEMELAFLGWDAEQIESFLKKITSRHGDR